ncbi:MAG: GNAT family N-acetyltransferase [Parabacteroides distasonis]|nr:GNAT family N-acetyltransferase [Parabacteroides distasonis]
MNNFVYSIEDLDINELFSFLNEVDSDITLFYPISQRVNIFEYSKKLKNNATHFCARNDNKLVGLISVYLNDFTSKIGYVTLVHVNIDYRKYGIASTLLEKVLIEARNKGFEYIDLEVYKKNEIAISLYEKKRFLIKKEQKDSYIMRLVL